jgi:type 1 glutamine amidotransferase
LDTVLGKTLIFAWFVCFVGQLCLAGEAPRPKLVLLIAGQSYETDRTLPAFAARNLAPQFEVAVADGAMTNPEHRFANFAPVATADVLLVSVWRRAPPQAQLDAIRRHVAAGKPVVGLATASHAWTLRKGAAPAPGSATWPEWDATVIGGNYSGHRSIKLITTVTATAPGHPILRGVTLPFTSKMELNQVSPLRPGVVPLLTGTVDGFPSEAVAWTWIRADGGRTFFTPLGHPEDFEHPSFQRLLLNGIRWAAGLPVE